MENLIGYVAGFLIMFGICNIAVLPLSFRELEKRLDKIIKLLEERG